jgi:hypothetical protein
MTTYRLNDIYRLLEAYKARARIIGYTDAAANAILEEELLKVQRSPTMTSVDALARASRRLAMDALGIR